jgi:hypothetical protein
MHLNSMSKALDPTTVLSRISSFLAGLYEIVLFSIGQEHLTDCYKGILKLLVNCININTHRMGESDLLGRCGKRRLRTLVLVRNPGSPLFSVFQMHPRRLLGKIGWLAVTHAGCGIAASVATISRTKTETKKSSKLFTPRSDNGMAHSSH